MAKNTPPKPKLSMEEYLKIKDIRTKNKLRLLFPLWVKILIAVPAAYLLFLLVYFLGHLRFLAER